MDICCDKTEFMKVASEIRSIARRLNDEETGSDERSKLRNNALILTIRLRNLQRKAHLRCQEVKQETIRKRRIVQGLCVSLEKTNYKNLSVLNEIDQCIGTGDDESEKELKSDAETHQRNLNALLSEIEERRELKNKVDALRSSIRQVTEKESEIETALSRLAPLVSNIRTSCSDLGKEVCEDSMAWPVRNFAQLQLHASKLPAPLFLLYKFIDNIHLFDDNPLKFLSCSAQNNHLAIRIDSTIASEFVELELAFNEACRLVQVVSLKVSDSLRAIEKSLLSAFDTGFVIEIATNDLLCSGDSGPIRYFIQLLCGNLNNFVSPNAKTELPSNVTVLRRSRHILDERVNLGKIIEDARKNPHKFRSTMSLLSSAKLVDSFENVGRLGASREGWIFVKLAIRSINHPHMIAYASISPEFPSEFGLPVFLYEMSNDHKKIIRSGLNCLDFNCIERDLYVFGKEYLEERRGDPGRVDVLNSVIHRLLAKIDLLFHLNGEQQKEKSSKWPKRGPFNNLAELMNELNGAS